MMRIIKPVQKKKIIPNVLETLMGVEVCDDIMKSIFEKLKIPYKVLGNFFICETI